MLKFSSGSADGSWRDFRDDGSQNAGMPFEINQVLFAQFQAKFGHLGNDIVGDIGSDGEFHIPHGIWRQNY